MAINKAKTVVGTLEKCPAKAGGRSPKGPAVGGTTVQFDQAMVDRSREKLWQNRQRHSYELITVD